MANKVGRPKIIKTPEKLMKLFMEHYENSYTIHKTMVDGELWETKTPKLITIQSFMFFLKYEKKLISNMTYFYELTEEFSQAKKEIEELMFNRYAEMGISKDYSTAFLIFYGKNKFGLSDKQEIHQTNINKDVELTDEELKAILND